MDIGYTIIFCVAVITLFIICLALQPIVCRSIRYNGLVHLTAYRREDSFDDSDEYCELDDVDIESGNKNNNSQLTRSASFV